MVPDTAGIYSTLLLLPDRTPEQRRAYRLARTAHKGVPHKTIIPFRAGRVHWSRFQRRDALGRFR